MVLLAFQLRGQVFPSTLNYLPRDGVTVAFSAGKSGAVLVCDYAGLGVFGTAYRCHISISIDSCRI